MSGKKTIIIFPKEIVPNPNLAMDQVFIMFPDHYPSIYSETKSTWKFGLDWPTRHDWYVDPDVLAASMKEFNLSPHQIPTYLHQSILGGHVEFLLSMFHSRALLAPTRANKRLEKQITTIVHIDDHDDLMPIIDFDAIKEIENTVLPIGDLKYSADSEDDVIRAINGGYINMGNFLTYYLLSSSPGRLFWVNPNLVDSEGWLLKETGFAKLGVHDIQLTSFYFDEKLADDYSWYYRCQADVPRSIEVKENEGVWLDIDIDVFCNRYNRDSDKLHIRKSSTNEGESIARQIESVFSGLSNSDWINQVEAASISISPGFFPSQHWDIFLPEIISRVKNLLS